MKNRFITIIGAIFFVAIFLIAGIRINNYSEWKITEHAIAIGGFPTQLGITKSIITPCIPSCQTPAGVATCCAPQTNMCITIVPTNGSFETTCPLYANVVGSPSGGMGNIALLSEIAIGKAGLTSGGQFIYGGTTNNMSIMTAVNPNVVLASAGGCYNCLVKGNFFNRIAEKVKFLIAGFKD